MNTVSKYQFSKRLATLVLGGLAVFMTAMPPVSAETRTLRVAYYVPATHIYATGAIEPFLKAIEDRSNGALTFNVFPSSQLGGGPDAVGMVQNGVADIAFMTTVYHSQELPASQYLVLPHGMDGMVAANVFWRATHEPGVVKDEWDDAGIVPLTTYANPPSEFQSTDIPLDGPEALAGQRMRAPGEVLTLIAEAVDAVPIEVTSSDQYEALQRGLVKTLNYTFSSWNAFKLSELLHNSTIGLNVYSTNPAMITSQKVLASLSPEMRELLLETGREFSVIGEKAVLDQNEEAFNEFVEGGLKTYEWSEEDKAWLNDRFEKIREGWVESSEANNLAGKDAAEEFAEFRTQAEADPENFPSYSE